MLATCIDNVRSCETRNTQRENEMTNGNIYREPTASIMRRAACAILLGMVVTVATPTAGHAQTITPPVVPDNLEVPAPNQPFLVGHGVGTQNYVCLPSPSIGRVAWTLFTPQATLFNDQHEQLITHFFSPNPAEGGVIRVTWEHSEDTSEVWGRVIASSTDPAFVQGGAIPWLLVQVVGARTGPTGGNTLVGTTFIQRVNTSGGVAPATGCRLPTDIGNEHFVPYTADYIFYSR
jgi:Protein of unknown function (DUF3455)